MAVFEPLAASPAALVAVVCVFALMIGSFLNVIIVRLPRMLERDWRMSAAEILDQPTADDEPAFGIVSPRSACPHCGARIRAWHNIPVISYLLLRGRCAHCGTAISVQYPLVELATALLSALVAWRFGFTPEMLLALVFTWTLIALTVIDWQTQFLPDALTLPLVWLGLLASLGGWFATPQAAIIGAAAGYLSLWLVYHAFRLLTGKEGMGYGDFKLLAAFGAWLGWQALPQIILIASAVGAVVGIVMTVSGQLARGNPMPFGPFLAAAGWLALVAGDTITTAYLQFTGLA